MGTSLRSSERSRQCCEEGRVPSRMLGLEAGEALGLSAGSGMSWDVPLQMRLPGGWREQGVGRAGGWREEGLSGCSAARRT